MWIITNHVTNLIMRKISFSLLFLMCNWALAQQNPDSISDKIVVINPEFSYKMLEPNQDLRKVNIFIEARKHGAVKNKGLTIGVSLIPLLDYQKSNTDSKFAYLMRHPTPNNQIGTEVSEAVIHSFQFSLTGTINNWLAAYMEVLYNPEQSFGAGTITSLGRNQLQLRKGFVVFGDLNDFPLYGVIGKMDAPFGQTGSVSPFSNSTMWHAFGGLGYGAQVGFKKWNLHATFMAVQGGAQFRAMHTPVGDSTSVPSMLNNFTADINYTLYFGDDFSFLFGGSYLHGSAYCADFPITHFKPCSDNNPAITAYGTITLMDRIIVQGGFATTLEVWPGTHNPSPPLDVFEASKVTSLDVGIRYDFNIDGKVVYSISGEYSDFRAGPDDSPWERQNQIIVGFAGMIKKSSKFFLELFRTEGYAPLNFISGSNPDQPFPAGETHSQSNVLTFGIVLGAMITF
jgi:hypothetical protein